MQFFLCFALPLSIIQFIMLCNLRLLNYIKQNNKKLLTNIIICYKNFTQHFNRVNIFSKT